jgi:hypothetical protein
MDSCLLFKNTNTALQSIKNALDSARNDCNNKAAGIETMVQRVELVQVNIYVESYENY